MMLLHACLSAPSSRFRAYSSPFCTSWTTNTKPNPPKFELDQNGSMEKHFGVLPFRCNQKQKVLTENDKQNHECVYTPFRVDEIRTIIQREENTPVTKLQVFFCISCVLLDFATKKRNETRKHQKVKVIIVSTWCIYLIFVQDEQAKLNFFFRSMVSSKNSKTELFG